jgi:hypothetical protein
MFKTQLRNKFEIENIIRKSLEMRFPKRFKMPFYANDTHLGIGHTFKFHRSSPFNAIWPDVLQKLHSLGMKNWQDSNKKDYTDRNNPTPSNWIGIRSARLRRSK